MRAPLLCTMSVVPQWVTNLSSAWDPLRNVVHQNVMENYVAWKSQFILVCSCVKINVRAFAAASNNPILSCSSPITTSSVFSGIYDRLTLSCLNLSVIQHDTEQNRVVDVKLSGNCDMSLCLPTNEWKSHISVSWFYVYSIVPWDDTKGIPALGRRRWWAEPVVRCVPIGQCWCDRLVSMPRRVSCTSELSHANML